MILRDGSLAIEQCEVVEFLRGAQGWSEFALSLYSEFNRSGNLSPKQWAAAERMRLKCQAKQKQRAAAPKGTGIDLSGLPSGMYAVPGGETRLKLCVQHGSGRWEGFVFVKDGAEYGSGKRYGMQRPGENYRGEVCDALRVILADPKLASQEYGRLVGRCGVCGRKLEDEESVARGIGPVCAGKF